MCLTFPGRIGKLCSCACKVVDYQAGCIEVILLRLATFLCKLGMLSTQPPSVTDILPCISLAVVCLYWNAKQNERKGSTMKVSLEELEITSLATTESQIACKNCWSCLALSCSPGLHTYIHTYVHNIHIYLSIKVMKVAEAHVPISKFSEQVDHAQCAFDKHMMILQSFACHSCASSTNFAGDYVWICRSLRYNAETNDPTTKPAVTKHTPTPAASFQRSAV